MSLPIEKVGGVLRVLGGSYENYRTIEGYFKQRKTRRINPKMILYFVTEEYRITFSDKIENSHLYKDYSVEITTYSDKTAHYLTKNCLTIYLTDQQEFGVYLLGNNLL